MISLAMIFTPFGLGAVGLFGAVSASAMAVGGAAGVIVAIPPFFLLAGPDTAFGIAALLTGLFSIL